VATIYRHPGSSQREIAKLARIKPGSLTEVLERLEKGGYVTRSRDPKDRRIIRVDLTERGKEFYQDLIARRDRFNQALLANVDVQERQQFVTVLAKMEEQLQNLAQEGNDQQ
jgi:DNA-binding MarR family transcriptional regulator